MANSNLYIVLSGMADCISGLNSKISNGNVPNLSAGYALTAGTATSAGSANTADKVSKKLVFDASTDLEYDGSASGLIKPGTGITFTKSGNTLTIANSNPTPGEANQNAFSTVTVGTVNINAGSTTDTLILSGGTGITLSGDSSNKKITISADSSSSQTTYYGTCSTASGTAEKAVTCTGYTLQTGNIIAVSFTAKSCANAKLNVNSTGAKNITRSGDTTTTSFWAANDVVTFLYDGTNYVILTDSSDANSTYAAYSFGMGYIGSSAGTASAATAAIASYALVSGTICYVKFTSALNANATLNINSKGAKPIYYNGAALTANTIQANDLVAFMYDGTNYHVVEILNRKLSQAYLNDTNNVGGTPVTDTQLNTLVTNLTTTLGNLNTLLA